MEFNRKYKTINLKDIISLIPNLLKKVIWSCIKSKFINKKTENYLGVKANSLSMGEGLQRGSLTEESSIGTFTKNEIKNHDLLHLINQIVSLIFIKKPKIFLKIKKLKKI